MLPIHVDCRHYQGAAPCQYHKRDGRACDTCGDYDPVRSRLLVVKLGAAGDVLRTTCLLPALRRSWPGAHITWITGSDARPMLEGHSLIDRLLTADECLPTLQLERFDAVYGLEADPASATLAALARAPERYGFACDDRGRVRPVRESASAWWVMGLDDRRKRENRTTYQQCMYELCELPGRIERPSFAVPPDSRRRASAFAAAVGLNRCSWTLGINTGGGRRWAQKKWTAAGYRGLISLTRTRHPGAGVVLLGGPEEGSLNAALLSAGLEGVFDGGCHNSFADFAALIETLDVLVTSDSLGLHAAQAVGTPVVAIVGPTSPWELEMYGGGVVVHAEGVDCLGCYRAVCDKPVTCMERLEPAAVLAAAEGMLQARQERLPGRSVPVSV